METLTSLERQIEKFRRAANEHPENLDTLMTYAQMCLRRDLRLEALQVFQRVLEVQPRAEARLALAQLFARQHLFAESYRELGRLFELDPRDILGHALLLWLQQREPVPDALQAHLGFTPERDALQAQRDSLEAERQILAGEVDQYRALSAGADPDPILLYHLEESRRRVERVLEVQERLDMWAVLAGDAPVQEKPPRAPAASARKVAEAKQAEDLKRIEAPAAIPERAEPAPADVRQAFYAGIGDRVAETLGRIGQTRGVTGLLVMSEEPYMVRQVAQEGDLAAVMDPVVEGVRALLRFQESLQYWVLECQDGIIVVQRVDGRHVLVVVGKTGANFGALRYAIDKSRSELAEILAQTPAA